MKRDIQKVIEDYHKHFTGMERNSLKARELHELKTISERQDGTTDIYKLIFNTWEFAFMVGYRAGQKSMRRDYHGKKTEEN